MLQALSVVIVGLGTLGQALFGFGGGLIIVPLVALLLGIKTAVALALVVQLAMGILVFPALKHVRWNLAWPVLLTMLPCTALGIWMYESFNEVILRIVLMVFIGLFLTNKLLFPNLRLFRPTPIWAGVAGAFGGILQGVLGTGGPPLVMLLAEYDLEKHEFRALVMLLLFAANLLRFALFSSQGLFSPQVQSMGLYSIPLVLLALFLGERLHSIISENTYRFSVYAILGLSFLSLGAKLLG
jgi:uncharacterized membrane protein YfcA